MLETGKESDTEALINIVLSSALERKTYQSMAEWFKEFNLHTRRFERSIDRAIYGGRLSRNVGFAFISAYQSAIEALFQAEDKRLSSFCVTEEKGNHPRAIETRLIQESGKLYISGSKKFVSGANDSECLYVACRDEREGSGFDSEGRPLIKMVKIFTESEGLEITAMPALGFVPEVSHGKVLFHKVALTEAQICEGDGYLNYVKAFRSYEDLHVLAALIAYRLGEAIEGNWPNNVIEDHISLLLALHSISEMDLNKSAAHIALAACRSKLEELINNTNKYFAESSPDAYQAWCRDQVLLNIAKAAHEKRTQKAWELIA